MKKRKERKTHETRQTRARVEQRRRPHVPPPESDVWPEEYRGKNWKPAYAFLFEGKCQLCAHSCPLPKSRQLLDKCTGITRLLHCTNHPRNPGGIDEVLPTDTCRNFKLKPWRRPKTRASASTSLPTPCKLRRGDKKIPLGNGLFVIVDAADYERLSKYRWYANRHGRQVYAVYHDRAKVVYMHRFLMRPRRGYVVDHIDHNGLNNRRDNLRVCTPQQHQANRGPAGGSSRFAGVFLRKDGRWQAGIRWQGKYYHVGLFDDEIKAAKARDRKAYELHGEFAYLNFPEDFRRRKRARRK